MSVSYEFVLLDALEVLRNLILLPIVDVMLIGAGSDYRSVCRWMLAKFWNDGGERWRKEEGN